MNPVRGWSDNSHSSARSRALLHFWSSAHRSFTPVHLGMLLPNEHHAFTLSSGSKRPTIGASRSSRKESPERPVRWHPRSHQHGPLSRGARVLRDQRVAFQTRRHPRGTPPKTGRSSSTDARPASGARAVPVFRAVPPRLPGSQARPIGESRKPSTCGPILCARPATGRSRTQSHPAAAPATIDARPSTQRTRCLFGADNRCNDRHTRSAAQPRRDTAPRRTNIGRCTEHPCQIMPPNVGIQRAPPGDPLERLVKLPRRSALANQANLQLASERLRIPRESVANDGECLPWPDSMRATADWVVPIFSATWA